MCETAGEWEVALKVLKLIPETRVWGPRTLQFFFSFRMSPVNEELLGTCMECFAGLHVLRQSLTSSDVLLM